MRVSRRNVLKTASSLAATACFPMHRAVAATSALPDSVLQESAVAMARKIREEEITSEALVAAHIQRVKLIDDDVNAIVHLNETALQAARSADKVVRNSKVHWEEKPLLGVPVTVKDNINVAGIPSVAGVPEFKNKIPAEDATLVRRLKDAGAIILGKTNMPPLGSAYETDNSVFGRTNNPFNLEKTPGGSSGGTGAIVSAYGSPLGVGNDSGGSIRVPAHFCGVAGIRTSFGRISYVGHPYHPPSDNSGPDFMVHGPLARHVEDLELALRIMAGPDSGDYFTSLPEPLRESKKVRLETLRIAYFTNTEAIHPTSETQKTVRDAAHALADAGGRIFEDRPREFDQAFYVSATINSDSGLALRDSIRTKYGVKSLSLPMKEVFRMFSDFLNETSDADRRLYRQQWTSTVRYLKQFMAEYDVVLCPVYRSPAFDHGESFINRTNRDAWAFPLAWSHVPQFPVGVVRCGSDPDGLPIGIQIVGRAWREDVVLAVMRHLEQRLGGWKPPHLSNP